MNLAFRTLYARWINNDIPACTQRKPNNSISGLANGMFSTRRDKRTELASFRKSPMAAEYSKTGATFLAMKGRASTFSITAPLSGISIGLAQRVVHLDIQAFILMALSGMKANQSSSMASERCVG